MIREMTEEAERIAGELEEIVSSEIVTEDYVALFAAAARLLRRQAIELDPTNDGRGGAVVMRGVDLAIGAALGEVRRQGGPEYLLNEARGDGLQAARAFFGIDAEWKNDSIEVVMMSHEEACDPYRGVICRIGQGRGFEPGDRAIVTRIMRTRR